MTEAAVTYDLIKEVFLLLDDGDRRLLGQFDLTVPRFYALMHLGNEPGLSPNQLSDLMFCDKSNVTRLIKGMEAEGLVVRKPHESDGRSVRLFLTDKGSSIGEQALDAHESYNIQRFGRGVLNQTDYLQDLLNNLKQNLEKQLEHI